MIFFICCAVLVLAAVAASVWVGIKREELQWDGKHVLITGGSAGPGLAFAKNVAARGARVSILARNVEKLQKAAEEIHAVSTAVEKNEDNGRYSAVEAIECDVTDSELVVRAVRYAEKECGPIDTLVCNAGLAMPGYFLATPPETFRRQMDVNYHGVVNTLKGALPSIVSRQKGGRVIIVSSAAGLVGFIGYSMYVPTKFAVRGLADCLRNELLPHNISVHIFYPSSMDTPGYFTEEKTKPRECREIEGTASLWTPEQAAEHLYDGISRNQYHITSESLIELLRVGMNGVTPRNFPLAEALILPISPLIEWVYRVFVIDRTVLKSSNN